MSSISEMTGAYVGHPNIVASRYDWWSLYCNMNYSCWEGQVSGGIISPEINNDTKNSFMEAS